MEYEVVNKTLSKIKMGCRIATHFLFRILKTLYSLKEGSIANQLLIITCIIQK